MSVADWRHHCYLLEHGERINAASLVGLRKSTEPAELICLTIEAKRKRYGGDVHLVIPPTSGVPVRHPRPAPVKRGRRYRYYVSQPAVEDSDGPCAEPMRLPARSDWQGCSPFPAVSCLRIRIRLGPGDERAGGPPTFMNVRQEAARFGPFGLAPFCFLLAFSLALIWNLSKLASTCQLVQGLIRLVVEPNRCRCHPNKPNSNPIALSDASFKSLYLKRPYTATQKTPFHS
jgi:hypothetical protein